MGKTPSGRRYARRMRRAKGKLEEIHQGLQSYVEPFDLPEPGEETLAEVREIARLGEEET